MPKAIIIYGPPGSGKGTQAELLTKKYNVIHFDTGRYIENLVHSSVAKKNKILMRERKNFDDGILCTPEWVLKITRDEAERIAKARFSIAFSGSPRTLFEAFGDGKNEGLIAALTRVFGKKNIQVIHITVPEKDSMKRNSARFLCRICGLPRLASVKGNHCALCAGELRKRTLDDPKVIVTRLREYRERTYPIIAVLKKKGIKITIINGRPLPYKVHEQIVKSLKME